MVPYKFGLVLGFFGLSDLLVLAPNVFAAGALEPPFWRPSGSRGACDRPWDVRSTL